MKVIVCKNNEPADVKEIGNELEDLQRVVDGYIEQIHIEDEIVLICNEEGKLLNLPKNKYLINKSIDVVDVICGDFIICAAREDREDFSDLTEEEIKFYLPYLDNGMVPFDFRGRKF